MQLFPFQKYLNINTRIELEFYNSSSFYVWITVDFYYTDKSDKM